MNRKFPLPGGFALMIMVAAAAAVSIFGFAAAQLTKASNFDTGNSTPAHVTPQKLVAAPMASAGAVVVLSPNDPGEAARIEIAFIANDELIPGNEIIITFEDDWGVPSTMSPSLIDLRASDVTNECGGASPPSGCPGTDPVGGPFSNQTVNPDGVRINFVGPENDEGEISLQVPDMNDEGGSGTNSIATGATVTVIFLQSAAGIINPSEGHTNNVEVSTSVDMTLVEAPDPLTGRDVATIARIELGDVTYDSISLLAIGVEGNESVTFFLDNDGDGELDLQEQDLCTVVAEVADSEETASCNITLNNPPFFPGDFGPGGGCDLDGVLALCNFINFVDSEHRSTGNPLAMTQDQVDQQTVALLVSCTPPGSDDWIVSASCTFQGSATAPANVIVETGITLTIDTGAALT